MPADDRIVRKPEKEPTRLKHDIEYAYCTELIIRGSDLDPDAIKRALLGDVVGDSMLVVGNGNTVKVHMHSNTPGTVSYTHLDVYKRQNDNIRRETAQERCEKEYTDSAENTQKMSTYVLVALQV